MGENGELRCTVTALQPQRGRLYKVTWDDGTEQEVYRPTWEAAGCGVGDSMTQEERELLLFRAAEERGREYALWLLSRRDYAETELKRKLRDKVGAEAADGASRRMTELGLVNDERYAVRLARELCLRKHYPRRRAAPEGNRPRNGGGGGGGSRLGRCGTGSCTSSQKVLYCTP